MTQPNQAILPLKLPEAQRAEDFVPHDAAQAALGLLNQMQQWPQRSAYLLGPPASGKRHLARLWAGQFIDQNKLDIAVDDQRLALLNLEAPFDAAQLFHLLNRVATSNGYLLITSCYAPAALDVSLADCASRLKALPLAEITAPDDSARAALLLKHFHDRQLVVEADVLNYMLQRLPRDYQALLDAAEALNQAGLCQQRKITVPLARDVLFCP